MSTARHDKIKLAKKLANLQAALNEYTEFCEEIMERNKAEEAGKDGQQA